MTRVPPPSPSPSSRRALAPSSVSASTATAAAGTRAVGGVTSTAERLGRDATPFERALGLPDEARAQVRSAFGSPDGDTPLPPDADLLKARDALARAALFPPDGAAPTARGGAGAAANDPAFDSAAFEERFAALAADPAAFHALIGEVYGPGHDRAEAESLRRRALGGDFAWLPEVRFVGPEVLGGARGAYDAASDTIYVADGLRGTALATEVFAEEAGHALDVRLNGADTAGDEGELFRRLLGGERLGATEMSAIRAEDDGGTIVVDGERRQVEFWSLGRWFQRNVVDPVVDNVIEPIVENVVEPIVEHVVKPIGEQLVTWGAQGLHTVAVWIDKLTGSFRQRALRPDEIAYLRPIYGDSIDYGAIRVQQGGIKSLVGMRSNTVGHDIFMQDGVSDDNMRDASGNLTESGRAWLQELGHEAMHVWQYEHQGSGYIGEALAAQWFGDGYDLRQALDEGKTFEQMNPEQQGMMAEYIGAAILLDGTGVLTEESFETVSDITLTPAQFQTVQNAHATLLAG